MKDKNSSQKSHESFIVWKWTLESVKAIYLKFLYRREKDVNIIQSSMLINWPVFFEFLFFILDSPKFK